MEPAPAVEGLHQLAGLVVALVLEVLGRVILQLVLFGEQVRQRLEALGEACDGDHPPDFSEELEGLPGVSLMDVDLDAERAVR